MNSNPTAYYDVESQMWIAEKSGITVHDKRGPGWAEQRLAELLQREAEIQRQKHPVKEVEDYESD